MSSQDIEQRSTPRPLRLWPGVVLVAAQWVVAYGLPRVAPDQGGMAFIGSALGWLAIVLWWLFFSRAPWIDRLAGVVAMVGAVAVMYRFVHPSISNGAMGMLLPIISMPLLSLGLVVSVSVTRKIPAWPRRAAIATAIVLACSLTALVRTGGISGGGGPDLHWRWTPTPEERLLAQSSAEPPPPQPGPRPDDRSSSPAVADPQKAGASAPSESPAVPSGTVPAEDKGGKETTTPAAGKIEPATPLEAAGTAAEWPGFRGTTRDSVIRGLRIETDWTKSPPKEVWRRPIGPGWSSFAVRGHLIYTQEQRGDHELVSCYDLRTGRPVWMHRDAVRFWESNGGAGPRATPTLSNGRVYTFGATGILNALSAADGSVAWSKNAASDAGKAVPHWGFASSPLVIGDLVIVAAAGKLVAYDLAKGELRWQGPGGGWGYSSPHRATIGGVEQIVLLNGEGAIGVAPADGKLLWKHTFKGDGIVQPGLTPGGDVLIGTGSGLGFGSENGIRRVAVSNGAGGWDASERWTTNGLKPYFNDFVVHEGHAYGFDGTILSCINLEDGRRKWKGGRYGSGQMMLLADQDLLLVLSEEGELALVRAAPEEFTEMARFKAIEGKTWNHPAMAGDIVLVRNGEEMAAFRLAAAAGLSARK